MDLDIEYLDALSTVPQWEDLFVPHPGVHAGDLDAARPRLRRQHRAGVAVDQAGVPGAAVTAFEAVRRWLPCWHNLAANGCGDVEVVPAAVWSAAGRLRFRVHGADAGALEDVEPAGDGPSIEVEPSACATGWRPVSRPAQARRRRRRARGAADIEDVCRTCTRCRWRCDLDARQRRLPACLDLLHRHGFDYALDDLHPVTWRAGMPAAGPFPGVAAWVVLVRAWPRRP